MVAAAALGRSPDSEAVAASRRLALADHLRFSPGMDTDFKEWNHFYVFGKNAPDVLVNFSAMSGVQTRAGDSEAIPWFAFWRFLKARLS